MKMVFLNFVAASKLSWDRKSALFFFYWTRMDKLEFTDGSIRVNNNNKTTKTKPTTIIS